ncbi:hypothetical protein [Legionella waltersii]|uniref:Substrate of the Dot/Icm secretion system n=1 Tax=Legionella waltersii TaxID=66969 RepID=A0A0W1ADI8_9GAMM|nr:hypothetical protein [Legionella waltersii]KTD79401.1 substrate of the Dot/Icm secretion system [Legionella waltersii]SNU97865.1 Dot/Icm secretion system substrate [Legionella waltersii]
MRVKADQITNAMKMGETSVEAARYVRDQIVNHKDKEISGNASLIKVANEYLASVEFMHQVKDQKWALGTPRETDPVKNMIANKGASFAQNLKESLGDNDVKMSIAINEEGKISRAFTSNGKKMSDEDTASMDGMMQDWFAKNNYGFHNGQIVDLKSLQRNEIKPIDPDKLGELMAKINDEATGMKSFCQSSGVPVDFTLYEQRGEKLVAMETQERTIKSALKEQKSAAGPTEAQPTQEEAATVSSSQQSGGGR